MSDINHIQELRKKIKEDGFLEAEELRKFFVSSNIEDRRRLREKKRESKVTSQELKDELSLIKFININEINKLIDSIRFAEKLRYQSYQNYLTLTNYSYISQENPDMSNLYLYLTYGEYCKKYDELTHIMLDSVFEREDNKQLFDDKDCIERSIQKLNLKNGVLLNTINFAIEDKQKSK